MLSRRVPRQPYTVDFRVRIASGQWHMCWLKREHLIVGRTVFVVRRRDLHF
jgi:hypothetical protein